MMGQLVKQETALQSMEEMKDVAQRMVDSGLLPAEVNTVQKAVAIAMKGRELGIPAVQALSEIYVVKGKANLKSELILQLATERIPGFRYDILELSDKKCVVEYNRTGRKPFIYIYTWEMAVKAGNAAQPMYVKYPDYMLFNRNCSFGLKMYAPDYKSIAMEIDLASLEVANEAISDLCEDNGNIVNLTTGEVVGKVESDPVVEAVVVEQEREILPHEMEGYEEPGQTEPATTLFGDDTAASKCKCNHTGCGKAISEAVWKYSIGAYKMALCVDHQKLYNKVG